MPTKPLTDDDMREALLAVQRAGGNVSAAAQSLDMPRPTLQHRLREAARRGITATTEPNPVEDSPVLQQKILQLGRALQSERNARLTEDHIKSHIIGLASNLALTGVPEWAVQPSGAPGSPGVPTLMLSDLHHGEVVRAEQINGTNEFDMEISRTRLRSLARTAIHLLEIISPDMQYPGIVMPLGGDMISGNIHDELMATNEFNTMPTVLDLYGELVALIRLMADTFGRVFLPCVTGNHGRDTHKIWNKDRHATSFDWLLYNFLAKAFENDPRVTFLIPEGPDAYYRVYGHRYLLSHGDQFRGGDGLIGALGPIIRGDHRKRSRNSQIAMEYDTLLIGHWHQYIHLTRLIVNGSLKGYDEYAYNNNFPFETPQQALWITHPTHGITFRMPVKVGKTHAGKSETSWVAIPGKGNN